jgi:exportin-T
MSAAQQQQQQQQQQTQQVTATLEDAREKGELQRGYYGLLHAVVHQNLASSLLQAPPQVLDQLLTALARGAAAHVDPSVRRLCMQVFERLLQEWCPAQGAEVMPGFKSFVVHQLGGQACILGLLAGGNVPAAAAAAAAPAAANTITGTASRLAAAAAAAGFVPLDARDAGTVALIGEAAAGLKLLHEKCGSDLLQHLCGLVLPASGLPGEVQQQLVYHIQESDAKQLKDFLRGLLLSVAGSVAK